MNSHINRLRAKIEKDPSQPEYIVTVWGVGYRLAEPARIMLHSLSFRLPAALVLLFLVIGIAMVWLTRVSADRYYQEVTQRLNAPVAMYVAGEAPLIRGGAVNTAALQSLAHKAMIINPSVEVYLLDTRGQVLAHDLGTTTPLRMQVALAPIQRFLASGDDLPLLGDDPRRTGTQDLHRCRGP